MRSSLTIPQSRQLSPDLMMWVGGLLCVGILCFLMLEGQFNLLFAVIIGGSLLLVSLRDKPTALLLTLAYLFLMGDLRRIFAVTVGQPTLDLLLLIGPAMALVLVLPRFARLQFRTALSKAMLFLLVVMILEIFNPRQGGLAVGLAGAVFYIAPLLWFWVGQSFGSPELVEKLLYRVIFPLALLASLLGFVQSFIGFLPYEQAWIDVAAKTYTSLYVGASIRPFGFSVSAAEYLALLVLGAVGTAAAYFGSRRRWALVFPILIVSIVLASGRTAVLRVIVVLALVWTLRKQKRFSFSQLVRIGLLATVGLILVVMIAARFTSSEGTSTAKDSAVHNALNHQLGGLAHPLDPRYSTAGLHSGMFVDGVVQGFTNPLGFGLGRTTQAGSKFNADESAGSSEVDISDMFISLGLTGGLLFLFVAGAAMYQAFEYLKTVRRTISLPVIAILASALGSWLIGGQYSISSLMLFLVGALTYTDNAKSRDIPDYSRSIEDVRSWRP